jgi:hypothetical protein
VKEVLKVKVMKVKEVLKVKVMKVKEVLKVKVLNTLWPPMTTVAVPIRAAVRRLNTGCGWRRGKRISHAAHITHHTSRITHNYTGHMLTLNR